MENGNIEEEIAGSIAERSKQAEAVIQAEEASMPFKEGQDHYLISARLIPCPVYFDVACYMPVYLHTIGSAPADERWRGTKKTCQPFVWCIQPNDALQQSWAHTRTILMPVNPDTSQKAAHNGHTTLVGCRTVQLRCTALQVVGAVEGICRHSRGREQTGLSAEWPKEGSAQPRAYHQQRAAGNQGGSQQPEAVCRRRLRLQSAV